jgi:hypothetical protein
MKKKWFHSDESSILWIRIDIMLFFALIFVLYLTWHCIDVFYMCDIVLMFDMCEIVLLMFRWFSYPMWDCIDVFYIWDSIDVFYIWDCKHVFYMCDIVLVFRCFSYPMWDCIDVFYIWHCIDVFYIWHCIDVFYIWDCKHVFICVTLYWCLGDSHILHSDESSYTLNICLGLDFIGGNLVFLRNDEDKVEVEHRIGIVIIFFIHFSPLLL